MFNLAGWQSGYAAACKAVNAGSIPASASKLYKNYQLNKNSSQKTVFYKTCIELQYRTFQLH